MAEKAQRRVAEGYGYYEEVNRICGSASFRKIRGFHKSYSCHSRRKSVFNEPQLVSFLNSDRNA
jgi:hypothetical protein